MPWWGTAIFASFLLLLVVSGCVSYVLETRRRVENVERLLSGPEKQDDATAPPPTAIFGIGPLEDRVANVESSSRLMDKRLSAVERKVMPGTIRVPGRR